MGLIEFNDQSNEAQTDTQKTEAILEPFIVNYSLEVRKLKDATQKDKCSDILMSHLLNLFNACIIRPK